MALLAANGQTHLNQQILALTPYTVTWFLDGRRLLQHAHDLAKVRAELGCILCRKKGTDASVHIRDREDGTVFVACPHRPRGGRVRVDQPLDVQSLLSALGWNLFCSACGAALQGDNDPQTATAVHVTCPCTSRDYRLAVA